MVRRPVLSSVLQPPLGLPYMGGLGGFSPLSLFAAGEQGLWYDPSDFTSMFQDSAGTTPVTAAGQPVGKILDKSGRGNHAVQATAGSRPTVQVDANGCYYLLFDGVDDSLATSAALDLSATLKLSICAGLYRQSDVAQGIVFEHTAVYTTPGGFAIDAADSALARFRVIGQTGDGVVLVPTAVQTASVVTGLYDETAAGLSNVIGRNNGVQIGGAGNPSAVAFASGTFNIGRRNNVSNPFSGRVYHAVLVAAAVTSVARTALERFVGTKTGVAVAT